MAENTKIEWAHHTVNLWWGCTNVHAGCDNCYAEALSNRFGNDVWGNDKPRLRILSAFMDLAKFQKLAEKAGEIHRVFIGSMMDIFEKPMPLINGNGNALIGQSTGEIRNKLFESIDLGLYPNLLFLFLTKRPSNINKYIPESWKENPPANVMFGTSVVNQETANTLIPQLLQVNGKRFLSCEPLLGFVVLSKWIRTNDSDNFDRIHWIIAGGESGKNARPMDIDWVRNLQQQCEESRIPFLFKQWGEWHPIGQYLSDKTINSIDQQTRSIKIGKKISGNFLYGRQYLEYPE